MLADAVKKKAPDQQSHRALLSLGCVRLNYFRGMGSALPFIPACHVLPLQLLRITTLRGTGNRAKRDESVGGGGRINLFPGEWWWLTDGRAPRASPRAGFAVSPLQTLFGSGLGSEIIPSAPARIRLRLRFASTRRRLSPPGFHNRGSKIPGEKKPKIFLHIPVLLW